MLMRNRNWKQRSGSAAVEFAVCLPLLLTVISGIWEVGRMVQVQNLMASAAREGGRQAAAGINNNATICQNVTNNLTMNGLSNVTISMVTLTNLTSSGRSNPQTANQLDQFQLTITVPYSSIRWSTLAQITPTNTLTVSSYWYSMLDTPITINTNIPAN